ncbi:MAG: universal stress protein [Candidatus Angelobacter sp.]
MKILLAVDDSDFSKASIEMLAREIRPDNAEVHILNVVESMALISPAYGFGTGPVFAQDYTSIIQEWRVQGEATVARAAKVLQSAGFNTKTIVREGDARTSILEYADEWRPDLIMVGSHGRRGLDRFLLGSVSDAVARHAHCSVWIVRIPKNK